MRFSKHLTFIFLIGAGGPLLPLGGKLIIGSMMIYCFDPRRTLTQSLFRRLLEVHARMFSESQNECFALLVSEHEKHCLANTRTFLSCT